MLVKLRYTLNISLNRIKSMGLNEKQIEKKNEMEVSMNKSIRIMILNTSIGLLFKLLMVFLPLIDSTQSLNSIIKI